MSNRIYIFGAHSRAQTLAVYLQALYPEIVIAAFLYDNDEANPGKIGEVPVFRPGDEKLDTECPVYIGTRGIYHEKISEHLRRLGFGQIHPVTVELDLRLRNAYLEKYFAEIGREYEKIDDLGDCTELRSAAVYVARSVHDKPLKVPFEKAPYEKAIQVGAALTEERLLDCSVTDDAGDNISARNRQFCELTALYWIWKNAGEDVVGLAHYRRHFILPQNWLRRMQVNKVDVILPVPLYVAPNLKENFKKRHDSLDWDYMMECLARRNWQEYLEAEAFFQKNLYSPCNMFIMRREVLDGLCEWLFPVLFAVAEHGGQKEDAYLNRYPGFISERLISFYFERHRDRYKVVYSDKDFLT